MGGLLILFGIATVIFALVNKLFKVYYIGFKGVVFLYGVCLVLSYLVVMRAL